MENQNTVPNSAYSFKSIVRPQIDEEFYKISTVASRLQVATNSFTHIDAIIVQPLLILVISKLNEFVVSLNTDLNKASDLIEQGAKYGRISFWILFCFVFLTFAVSLVVLCLARGKMQGKGNRALAKFFLVLFGFLLLLLWVLIFVMIVGNVILGSTCGIVKELNMGNKSVLSLFNMSDLTKSTLNMCFFQDSEGDLTKLYNTYTPGSQQFTVLDNSIQSMHELFDGISGYIKWKNQTDLSSLSKSIPLFTKELQKFQNGNKYDYSNVSEILKKFNDVVSCEKKRYMLQATCNNA